MFTSYLFGTWAEKKVVKVEEMMRIKIRPHDLRQHAATLASRSGVPIEIVSKVILRHADLSTNQRYIGKVSDYEAIRWFETLCMDSKLQLMKFNGISTETYLLPLPQS